MVLGATMKYYRLQFMVQVSSSKYREFVNLMEKEIQLKPMGCTHKMIGQSLDDSNVFDYSIHWSSYNNLEEHINSVEFRSLMGAVKVLTSIWKVHVEECSEIESIQL